MADRAQDPNMLRWTTGNFRSSKSVAQKAEQERRRQRKRERPGNSPAHLACIRRLPCLVCGVKTGVHVHHLRSNGLGQTRGIGQKTSDKWTVPVCFAHHDAVHRIGSKHERDWFIAEAGVDAYELAEALWRETGNVERLARIIEAHKR